MTGAEVKMLMQMVLEFQGATHSEWIALVNKCRAALDGCVLLTAEEAAKVRDGLWTHADPALFALLTPEQP